jgi:hypothetical protein
VPGPSALFFVPGACHPQPINVPRGAVSGAPPVLSPPSGRRHANKKRTREGHRIRTPGEVPARRTANGGEKAPITMGPLRNAQVASDAPSGDRIPRPGGRTAVDPAYTCRHTQQDGSPSPLPQGRKAQEALGLEYPCRRTKLSFSAFPPRKARPDARSSSI